MIIYKIQHNEVNNLFLHWKKAEIAMIYGSWKKIYYNSERFNKLLIISSRSTDLLSSVTRIFCGKIFLVATTCSIKHWKSVKIYEVMFTKKNDQFQDYGKAKCDICGADFLADGLGRFSNKFSRLYIYLSSKFLSSLK